MSDRYFATPPLSLSETKLTASRKQDFLKIAETIARECWSYYEQGQGRSYHHNTLYCGGLGPCAYLRLKLGLYYFQMSQDDKINAQNKKENFNHAQQLFTDGLHYTQSILHQERQSSTRKQFRQHSCTLLENSFVGSLTLSIIFLHYLKNYEQAQVYAEELLQVGDTHATRLVSNSECEILYGACGYLSSILMIRYYLKWHDFGKSLVLKLIPPILANGQSYALQYKHNIRNNNQDNNNDDEFNHLPLVWKWHDKVYLGGTHGICGILTTLLHFSGEFHALQDEKKDLEALKLLEDTLNALNHHHLHPSGNLSSSLGSKSDRLVHWCHGAPGHILLLTKAYELYSSDNPDESSYLQMAQTISQKVIYPRGLLRKGVGLCHGIAGNAYTFLSIHRASKKRKQKQQLQQVRRNQELQENPFSYSRNSESPGRKEFSIQSEIYLHYAIQFANFGIQNLTPYP